MNVSLSKIEVNMKLVRYEENPFIEKMMIPVKGKRIQLSRLGRDYNVLINQETGEVHGTHITTFKKVDAEQFVKLFTANIALTFELKAAGIKAFNVLLWTLQNKSITKDLIPLDKIALDEFLKAHNDKKIQLSQPTFWRGLNELEQSQIIAKHIRQGWYYINPNFVFNGDRIAFTSLFEKE
jgi:hypothetical protein